MRRDPAFFGAVILLVSALAALGVLALGSPSPRGSGEAGSPTASASSRASAMPSGSAPPPGQAPLTVRAAGYGAACRTLAGQHLGCVAYVRISPADQPDAGRDWSFDVSADTAQPALAPEAGAPRALAPGTYNVAAHLDSVAGGAAATAGSPGRHVIRSACQASAVVASASQRVSVRIRFDTPDACRIVVTVAAPDSPSPIGS